MRGALCRYLCFLCWGRSEEKAWIHLEGVSLLQGGSGTWTQSHLLEEDVQKRLTLSNEINRVKILFEFTLDSQRPWTCSGSALELFSPRLGMWPFLRIDGGRGGGGGGGGVRLESSVVGERAGGVGGGASRHAPVTMGQQKCSSHSGLRSSSKGIFLINKTTTKYLHIVIWHILILALMSCW